MNTNNKIYLDANFLVFLALPKDPVIKKRVRVKLAQILASKRDVCISCLVLDELWHGVKQTFNSLNNVTKSNSDEPIYSVVSQFTNDILQKFSVVQFTDPVQGTKEAMKHIKVYRLRPRDAFHLAMMDDNSISEIVTDDNDFNNIDRIKVSSF